MKLLAISDLHLGHTRNREALEQLPAFAGDWLIVAGDIGARLEYFDYALTSLGERFAKLLGSRATTISGRRRPTSRGCAAKPVTGTWSRFAAATASSRPRTPIRRGPARGRR